MSISQQNTNLPSNRPILNYQETTKVNTSEPYSIFDKRQKALIVAIASIAATCEYFY
jgi:hypothetical protein